MGGASRKDRPVEVLAETIAEAFVRRALAIPDEVAVADRISGVLKYRKLLVAARLFARRLGQLPEQTVGVMLPASVAADVVFFGLHLAGKLPAMLNWTTGPAYLAHAAEKLGIRHVVTSRKLIDRLGIEIQGAEYLCLEDIRPQIGKLRALATLLATYLFPRTMLRSLPRQNPAGTGRSALHFRVGKHAEGGPLTSCQPREQCASGHRPLGPGAVRCHARAVASLS